MTDISADLGDLEREVMQIIWDDGPMTADAVRERLQKPLKDSTVRTVLRRLEDKNYVTHTTEGRTFLYSAVEARGLVAARAVKRLVDWFCDGAIDEVLVGMVDGAVLDSRQLKLLGDKIAEAKARNPKKD